MDSSRKKELKNAYKTKTVTGGVCCIRCSGNQRLWIQSTKNLEGLKNRFDFSISIQSCPDPSMRSEWAEYGSEAFSFTVLEEIKKGENQTDREFADDIKALYEMWTEKYQQSPESVYAQL